MNLEPLTKREKQVAELLRLGYTNREIGIELIISVRTVESHRQNIYGKWHINSRRELIKLLSRASISQVLILPSDLINESSTVMIGEL